MNSFDDGRLREAQQIVVAAQITAPVLEALAAKLRFAAAMTLDHRAHGAVEYHDTLLEQRGESVGCGPVVRHQATRASLMRGLMPKAWQIA